MLFKNRHRGFTLVEILIVVIILGILASIVIPQFTNASTDARKSALTDQLHNLRVQIQLYTLQHGDTRPDLDGNYWKPMIDPGLFQGRKCGPYLPTVPRNTLNDFTDILVVAADPKFGDDVSGTNIGFVYNPNNGFIWGTNRAGNKIYNEAEPEAPNNY